MYKFKKFISLVLIYTLISLRVFSGISLVLAVDGVPGVPPPPGSSTFSTLPRPPSNPPPPSNAPPPTVPSIDSNTATIAPPRTSAVAPTTPPLPTEGTLPTSHVEPTAATLDNLSNLSGSDPDNSSGNSSNSDNGTNTNNSNSSASSNDTSSSSSVNDPANIGTGYGSQNYSGEELNKKLEVMNQNLADMQNKIDQMSLTGFNFADLNTLSGQVFSGDALASLNLLNKLNSNMTGEGSFAVYNIYGNYLNDLIFKLGSNNVTDSFDSATSTVSKNAVTGALSDNTATSNNTFTVKEANGNDALLNNDINLQAVSGGNSASTNTGNGVIKTGDATAIGNIVNLANSNINTAEWLLGVVNIYGTMLGNILLPPESNTTSNVTAPAILTANTNTGALSDNVATFQSDSNTNIENSNTANITSNLETMANTGDNTSSFNTGGGLISTGKTDVSVSNTTIANKNDVNDEGTVWMIIVNEAGKWVGHIIGAPYDSNYASNSLGATQTTVNNTPYYTDTFNTSTGALSQNDASYSQTDNTDITNANSAAIVNNITANADSGKNTASSNTGAGIIDTGNAKVALNLVNVANTNVTAKKFIAVIVNILGEFLGNIIPPNYQTANTTTNSTSEAGQNINPTPTSTNPHIGGVENFVSQPTPTPEAQNETNTYADNSNYQSTPANNQASENIYEKYYEALNKINNYKKIMSQKKNNNTYTQAVNHVEDQTRNRQIFRGIYLSDTFAKATETTFAGMLFGGAKINVTGSWLAIVPFGILIYLLRRRKKFNFTKYLNLFLEVIL